MESGILILHKNLLKTHVDDPRGKRLGRPCQHLPIPLPGHHLPLHVFAYSLRSFRQLFGEPRRLQVEAPWSTTVCLLFMPMSEEGRSRRKSDFRAGEIPLLTFISRSTSTVQRYEIVLRTYSLVLPTDVCAETGRYICTGTLCNDRVNNEWTHHWRRIVSITLQAKVS